MFKFISLNEISQSNFLFFWTNGFKVFRKYKYLLTCLIRPTVLSSEHGADVETKVSQSVTKSHASAWITFSENP